MHRKYIGISIISVMAAAIIFGTVGSLMEVIAATSAPPPADAEYVPRLADDSPENPAIVALKYACPFH